MRTYKQRKLGKRKFKPFNTKAHCSKQKQKPLRDDDELGAKKYKAQTVKKALLC